MASGWGRPGRGGFNGCPSPLPREWVRPARSHQVGPQIKVMGPSEGVWRRLPLPGTVVTWRVTDSWEEGTASDARIWRGFRLTDVPG